MAVDLHDGFHPLVGGHTAVGFSELLHTESLGLVWLVLLAIGLSAVSLFYYLQVLKQIFVVQAPASTAAAAVPAPPLVIQQVVVIVLALAVIALVAGRSGWSASLQRR